MSSEFASSDPTGKRPWVPDWARHLRYIYRERRRRHIESKLLALSGGRVLSGPFKGMTYVPNTVNSALGPKLLGSYEMELHAVVESIIAGRFECLINIGAAEGYYAVGLLTRCSSSRVVAFESSVRGRRLLSQLASANRVGGRLEIRGRCGLAELVDVLRDGQNTAVVCDIEGAEQEVLDPTCVPQLRHATVLVELHEFKRPGVSTLIKQRFSASHHVRIIGTTGRQIHELPTIRLPERVVLDLAAEHRPARMEWLWLTPSVY